MTESTEKTIKKDPHSDGSLGCWLRVFKPGLNGGFYRFINKNRPVSLMKQETIGIIFNWDISTMHPLCPPQNIAWQYMVTYLMSPEIPKILAVLLL